VPGNLVPWNVQCVNTCPDIFQWQLDSATIGTSDQGLYEISFGFFAEKDVNVELLVNSEVAIASLGNKATTFSRCIFCFCVFWLWLYNRVNGRKIDAQWSIRKQKRRPLGGQRYWMDTPQFHSVARECVYPGQI